MEYIYINSFVHACQGTMETFTIILTVTQFFYVLAIRGGRHGPVHVERRGNFA
jgi:hypothetical protein